MIFVMEYRYNFCTSVMAFKSGSCRRGQLLRRHTAVLFSDICRHFADTQQTFCWYFVRYYADNIRLVDNSLQTFCRNLFQKFCKHIVSILQVFADFFAGILQILWRQILILILILIKISLTKFGRRPSMQNPGATLPAFWCPNLEKWGEER